MLNKEVDIQYPVLNHEESIANIALNTCDINKEHTLATITNVLDTKDNNMFFVVLNSGDMSVLTIKAGDAYPNSMLGDLQIEIPFGFSAINLADLPRFVKADSSIDVEFKDDFVGKFFVIGKYKFRPNERVEW